MALGGFPMSKVGRIDQKTQNRFLNFFEFEAIHRDGKISPYYFSAKNVEAWLTGALSVVIYAWGDGVITQKTAKTALGTVIQIANEEKEKTEKTDKPKKTAVEEYLKKVK